MPHNSQNLKRVPPLYRSWTQGASGWCRRGVLALLFVLSLAWWLHSAEAQDEAKKAARRSLAQSAMQFWSNVPLDERQSKTDVELVEALEDYRIPWAAAELRLRCVDYSQEQLEAVVREMLRVGAKLASEKQSDFSTYIRDVVTILPEEFGVPAAIKLTSGMSLSERTVLITQFRDLDSALAAETLYDMYFEVEELANGTSDRHAIDLCVRILSALQTCGERGIELATLLGGGTPEQAAENVRWSKMTLDERLATLIDKCRRTGKVGDLTGYSYGLLPEDIQGLVRRDVVARLEDADSERRRGSGMSSAEANVDPYFLPYLKEIVANDPYSVVTNEDEIAAAMDEGRTVEPVYGRYPNRERAREVIHKIKEANFLYTRKEQLEYDLAQADQQIARIEANVAEGEPLDPSDFLMKQLDQWRKRAEGIRNEIARIDALPEKERLELEVTYREDVRDRNASALKEYQERGGEQCEIQRTTRTIAQLDAQIADLKARIAQLESASGE